MVNCERHYDIRHGPPGVLPRALLWRWAEQRLPCGETVLPRPLDVEVAWFFDDATPWEALKHEKLALDALEGSIRRAGTRSAGRAPVRDRRGGRPLLDATVTSDGKLW